MLIDIRDAKYQDSRLLWEWANDPWLRKNAFSTKPIDWEEHRKWFDKKLRSSTSKIYIGYLANIPIGQVRFDWHCKENRIQSEIDISVCREQRGKGYGTILLNQSIKAICQKRKIKKFKVFVKSFNEASIKMFKKNEFIRNSELSTKDIVVLELTID